MSKKQGSYINSPLFMEDPIPSRNVEKNKKSEEKFYLKGNDDDDILVKSQGGSFQLLRNNFRETLKDLKTYHDKPVKDLDSSHTESFRNVVEAMRLLYGSQAIYDLVLKDIHSVFSDIKSVVPGTVAAFFIGCFSDDQFPGPIGCSPKCVSSLPPTEGTPGYSSCDDLVLVYSKGTFNSLNEKRSQHCYILIEDQDFKEFSSENIKQLKESGIESVSLIFGNPDGSYKEIKDKVAIDSLPISIQSEPVKTNQTTTTMSVAGVVFSILVIILVILLIIFLFKALSQ